MTVCLHYLASIIILPNIKQHDLPPSEPVCKRQTLQTSCKADNPRSPYEHADSLPKSVYYINCQRFTIISTGKNFPISLKQPVRYPFAIPSLFLRYPFAIPSLFLRFSSGGIAMVQQCAIKIRWYMYRQNINIFLCKSAHMQRIWQKGKFMAYR